MTLVRYASKMESLLECFDDMLFASPDNYTVQTSEGKQPVLEAIRGIILSVYLTQWVIL